MLTFDVHEIDPAEWGKLEPIYQSQGDTLPSAEQNRVIVAESGGGIVGMCGVNLVAHIGPLWVAPEFRGNGMGQAMTQAAEDLIKQLGGKGYLMFPSNRASSRVAEKMGLEQMSWKVFRREF